MSVNEFRFTEWQSFLRLVSFSFSRLLLRLDLRFCLHKELLYRVLQVLSFCVVQERLPFLDLINKCELL